MISIENIRQKYSAEIAFIILTIRIFLKVGKVSELIDLTELYKLDWQLVYRMARLYGIRPVVYKVVSLHPENIDSEFIKRLREDVIGISTANMEKLKELTHLITIFNDKGIRLVPHKGILLSHLLFGNYVSRETVDIDFLIEAKDFSNIRIAFLDLGYQSKYYYHADYEHYLLKYDVEYQFHKHISGNKTISIEVHWNVIHGIQDTPITNAALFNSLEHQKLLGASVPILKLDDTLLVMLIHHGVNDLWRSLKHMLDLAAFIEKYANQIDWKEFKQKTIETKVYKASCVGFTTCYQLFGSSIPPGFHYEGKLTNLHLDDVLKFPPRDKHKLIAYNIYRQVLLRDSFTQQMSLGLSYIRTLITPNIRDVEVMQLPKSLSLLYFFVKPFLILKKRL